MQNTSAILQVWVLVGSVLRGILCFTSQIKESISILYWESHSTALNHKQIYLLHKSAYPTSLQATIPLPNIICSNNIAKLGQCLSKWHLDVMYCQLMFQVGKTPFHQTSSITLTTFHRATRQYRARFLYTINKLKRANHQCVMSAYTHTSAGSPEHLSMR